MTDIMENNRSLLREVNTLYIWQVYAKTRPLKAKLLTEAQSVHTLEGILTYNAGDYLCKGEAGDIWGQTAESLHRKYIVDVSELPDSEGWQKYLPNPESSKVMAAEIEHDFQVEHQDYGTMTGESGDFLVKSYADKDLEYPTDIWIVKHQIFLEIYLPQYYVTL